MYKKILFINPFGIGDVLFTTPIIHTLKDAFPSLKIGYLCNRRTAGLLESNPYVDSIFIYERDEFEQARRISFFLWLKKISSFLTEIKKEGFDACLDFSLNTQYGFFAWYAGIGKRIGYNYKSRGRFLTKAVKLTGYSEKHIVEYYTELLKYLGISPKYKNLELYLKDTDKSKADEILLQNNIHANDITIGIIPGGGKSWGRDACLKHWPAHNFGELADKIVENYKAKIIILGDFSEKEIAKKVKENMRHNAIDFCGEVSLGESAALLNKTNLVITNDGGPLHMAAALGKKTISFFGPVDPNIYGPYPPDKNHHVVLKKILDCSPCYRNFRLNTCLKSRECLEKIDVMQALQAVQILLRS